MAHIFIRRKHKRPSEAKRNRIFKDFFARFEEKYGKEYAPFWLITSGQNPHFGSLSHPVRYINDIEHATKNSTYQLVTDKTVKKYIMLGIIDGFEYGNPYVLRKDYLSIGNTYKRKDVKLTLNDIHVWSTPLGRKQLIQQGTLNPHLTEKDLAGWFVRCVEYKADSIRPKNVLGAFMYQSGDLEDLETKLHYFYGYNGHYGYMCRVFGDYLAIIQMSPHYFNCIGQGMYHWIVYDLRLSPFESAFRRDIKRLSYGFAKSVYHAKTLLSSYLQ